MKFFELLFRVGQMERMRFAMFLLLFSGLCHLSWRTGRLVDLSTRAIAAQERMIESIDLMLTSKHAEAFLTEHRKTQEKIDRLSEQILRK
jgi:hypothetical protein